MAQLKNQPSAAPSRKIWAVAISGGLTSAIVIAINAFAPDLDTTVLSESLRTGIEVGLVWAVSCASGYFTRSRA